MRKMRELRRIITILLSVAMLVTSVPQTGTVALAAGLGEEPESKSASTVMQVDDDESQEDNSGSDDTTQSSDTKENGAEDDSKNTEQPETPVGEEADKEETDEDSDETIEDGKEEVPDEDSDEVIEDEKEEVPDEDSDETIEDGKEESSDEEADETIEDGGEEIPVEDDSISMNALEAKTDAVDIMAEGDVPSEWDAVIEYESDKNIIINVGSFKMEGGGTHKERIVEILKYCAQQGKNYHSFQLFNLENAPELVGNNGEVVISKDIVNAAVKVWAGEYGYIGFDVKDDEVDVQYDFICPHTIENDITLQTAVNFLPNQGMKIKLSADNTDFPGEELSCRWSKAGDGFYKYFGQEECDLGVLRLENGNPTEIVKDSYGFYDKYLWEGEDESGDGRDVIAKFTDFNELQSSAEYLITPIFDVDEEYALDMPTELKSFIHSDPDAESNAVWTSLNPDMMAIDENGLLTANGVGEAYYYVKYTSNEQTYGELHKVEIVAVTEGGGKLDYIGEIRDGENGSILAIDAEGHKLTPQKIVTILNYYQKKDQHFDEIQFYLNGSKECRVSKDVLNAARNVLTENDEGKLRTLEFDYSVGKGFYSYRLDNPKEITKDVVLSVNEQLLANQGIKIKPTANTRSLAECVSLAIGWDGSKNISLDNCLDAEETGAIGIFKLSSGIPVARIHESSVEYKTETDNDSAENRVLFLGDLNALQQNTEYLITPIYEDDSVPVGKEKELKEDIRRVSESSAVTSVTGKSLDTDVLSIDSQGVMKAWEPGETYYCVKYKAGGAAYLEVHMVNVTEQQASIKFDDPEITMEPEETKYLRLRFYPSEAERDPGNPDEIMWETSNDDVVRLVKYNEGGEADETGTPNGEIQAVGAGEATITAYYMVDQDDGNGNIVKDDDGNPVKVKGPSATCEVTVTEPLSREAVQEEADNLDLYAVTNLDTKLSDIAIQKDGTPLEEWSWQDPNISLANFKNMEGHAFPAVYTAADGRSVQCNLWVRMVTVTGVTIGTMEDSAEQPKNGPAWSDEVPASLTKGETITLGRGYLIDNDNEKNPTEYQAIRDRMDDHYKIEWTSSPKNAGTVVAEEDIPDGMPKGSIYQYTASIVGKKQKPEKKTFTVSMKDKKTNKVLFKATRTITVTVKDLYDFDDYLVDTWDETDDMGQMWLKFRVDMPLEDYNKEKLTITSEDTSILQLNPKKKKTIVTEETDNVAGGDSEGEGTDKYTIVSIPCKNPKPGTAWIKVTAPDEMKTFRRYSIEFPDKEPKLIDATAVTINKAMNDRSATVTIRTHADWPLVEDDNGNINIPLTLNKKETESIECSVEENDQDVPDGQADSTDQDNTDAGTSYKDYRVTLSLIDKNLRKGKNTVGMKLAVKSDTVENPEEYTLNLTLNVTDSTPKVSFKQAKKVNLFYNDDTGRGVLNVNTGGVAIHELQLEDSVDKKGNPIDCGYVLETVTTEEGEKVYYIARKDDVSEKNTKGILTYSIEGYDGTFRSAFTVKTENKKPTIVLSAKSDILYPNIWYTDSWLTMFDKATGECMKLSDGDEVHYVVNKKKNICPPVPVEEFSEEGGSEVTGKNTYKLLVTPGGNIVSRLQGTDAEKPSYSKKADKMNLEIKKANWNDWVAVSYSLQVNTSKPKLTLGASTLTLNKNSEVYRAQMARTSLRLKGCNNNVMQDEHNWVTITGQDEKSKKVLRVDNSLVLQYWGDDGDIIARFNNSTIAPGKYKFTVKVGNEGAGTIASTTLTVKVVDSPMAKNLKVSSKGSIDVLNREGTCITYTPKLSNLSGEIKDGWLEGRDADLFATRMEDGKLVVRASGEGRYSTKNTYQVDAVFLVETRDYDSYTVRTDKDKPLSIKLKQGKPKLTASTANNTLYRQLENTVEIKLAAVLNKQAVVIEDVWPLNYTDDFVRQSMTTTDDNGVTSVTLGLRDRYDADSITKSGKTWKVKLAVRYRDKAGNEKDAQVTCPIVVK